MDKLSIMLTIFAVDPRHRVVGPSGASFMGWMARRARIAVLPLTGA
jgi:hypothetical protein